MRLSAKLDTSRVSLTAFPSLQLLLLFVKVLAPNQRIALRLQFPTRGRSSLTTDATRSKNNSTSTKSDTMPSLLERPVLPPRWSTPTLPQSYRSIQNKDYEQSSPVTTPTTPCYPAGLRCPPRTSLSAPTTSRLPSIDVGIETILNRHRDRTPVALLPSYNASSPSISMQNTVSQDAPTHHIGSYAPIPPAPLTSIRPSSGPWNPSDDQTLIAARAKGMNWAPIQQAYFPSKTPNACRKRHERLMERRSADDWDGFKLENLAKNYMAMRREIWSGVAAQMGEKWNYVEQKVCAACLLESIAFLECVLTTRTVHVSGPQKPATSRTLMCAPRTHAPKRHGTNWNVQS